MTTIDEFPLHANRDAAEHKDKTLDIKRRFEFYNVRSFSERSDPEGALLVQQIHGESYIAFGFVFRSALDEYGRLHPAIDRARGDNVSYYLATPKEGDESLKASVRIIDVPAGGEAEDLPAFSLGYETMEEEYKQVLREAQKAGKLREVTSLCFAERANPAGSFELIRQIIQEAIKHDTDEMWIINFVASAHTSIRANFSPNIIQQIGKPLMIGEENDDISSEVKLVPVIIEPCKIPGQMVDYLLDDSVRQLDKVRVLKTLHFVLDGLEECEIDDDVRKYMAALPQGRGNE